MPFSLSNSGSSFCCLVEKCPGNQKFSPRCVCIFALGIDVMFDHSQLIFNRLKEIHLKLSQRNVIFKPILYFWVMCYLPWEFQLEKVRDWPTPTNVKEVHSFLRLTSYYCRSIPKFAQMACCLHELVGPTSKIIKKGKGQKKERKGSC